MTMEVENSSGELERAAGGASKFLTNLPSRGLFSSTTLSSNLGSMRVYVCDHDTSPPEEQLIKTNSTNILIRSLQISKQRIDAKDAKASVEISKGKRSATRPLDGKSLTKRANTNGASSSGRQDGSNSGFSERMLQTMTVERLRALLKERGLSPKGKKLAKPLLHFKSELNRALKNTVPNRSRHILTAVFGALCSLLWWISIIRRTEAQHFATTIAVWRETQNFMTAKKA